MAGGAVDHGDVQPRHLRGIERQQPFLQAAGDVGLGAVENRVLECDAGARRERVQRLATIAGKGGGVA
jgi:hypothetical protein